LFSTLLHRRARTLISTAIREWLFDIQGLAISTQKDYRRIITEFTMDLPKKYISSITSTDVSRHLSKFAWHHENSSTNKVLMCIKSFFRFLSEAYNITNVTVGLRKRKEKMPYQPFISKNDLDKILASATQKESDIIKMLANTGLRASELCGLKHISPNLSSIRIQGKGGKIRTIPCNQTVREILSRSINLPKNRKSIYNICKNAGDKVKVHLAPHVLRRFFATQLLNKGVSLLIISRLLGHSSVQTTELYLKLDSSYLSGATDVLD